MASVDHTNKAVVLTELKKFVIEERPFPKPQKNQVVVQIRSVGVCGSDVHYYAHGQCGAFKVKGPIVLGHECSGVIAAVGSHVTSFKVGDRVALEPGIPCRVCEMCRTGKYNLCPDVEFLATPPFDGALARFILHEADFCFKIPDHVSFEEAAMLEPFSVGVYACERGQVTAGHSVLITGAGPIGLTALLAARAFGATNIILADINPFRLEVAKKMGAPHVVNSSDANFHQKVLELVPRGVDVSIDCSGAESAIRGAVLATKNGGKFCSVGRGAAVNVNFPLFDAADREVDIVGVFRYKNVYPKALELVASGRVDLKPLVSHRFTLEQSEEAFQTALTGKGNPIKIAINF